MKNKNVNNQGIPAEQEKKDRQLNNLIDIVEKHTRTERHLEKYSDIGDPKNKENAEEKNDLREKQINELKSQIVCDNKKSKDKYSQLKDLKENYEFADDYIKSNKKHMNQNMLGDIQKKQNNRKTQMKSLENNKGRKK